MIKENMKKNWAYIPIETASGFKQVIPMPGTDDSFIAVQPKCRRDSHHASKLNVGNLKYGSNQILIAQEAKNV